LDLSEPNDIFSAFEGQELVIHLAAMIHAATPQERELQERVNVEGTREIIKACRRARVARLVYVSSVAAIGISAKAEAPADESFQFNLDHLRLSYNVTKHRAEQLVLAANGPQLETVVANPGVIFGRAQKGYQGAAIIERVLRRSLVICTHGGLSVVHVDDVVQGIQEIAEKGRSGQRYILSGQNLSFKQIADIVCQTAGAHRRVILLPNCIRDLAGIVLNAIARTRGRIPYTYLDRRYAYAFYSNEKAKTELGFNPRPFASIIQEYLDHAWRGGGSPLMNEDPCIHEASVLG
jgi:dihydroflavonol-4-reductase